MLVTAVESTTLTTVAYDAAYRMLWLQFRSGAVYRYFGVPPTVHQALMAATSKGAYFNHHIRGHFSYQREPNGLPTLLSPAVG
jgi:hypothetical protein